MNRRVLTVLLLAFVIAGACGLLVYRMLKNRVVGSQTVATTKVVAVASDIKLGAVLNASNLTTVEIAGSVPTGAILKPENAIGRGVVSDLYKGEPVLESRLAPLGSGGGMAATIPQGMRACAVKVDDVVGVAGFVTPGMRVDVLISGIPPGAPSQSVDQGVVARTILQNIQVLSAGTDIQKDAEGKPKQVQVVNLLVTPEQAEKLSLASNQQVKIQLVLRNPLDTKTDRVPGTAMVSLFADSNAGAANARRAAGGAKKATTKAFVVEVMNGSKRSEARFTPPEEKQ